MEKELKIEGVFYLKIEGAETYEDAIRRFEKLIETAGIVENNSCTSFSISNN